MQHGHLRHPEAGRLPGSLQQHDRHGLRPDQRGFFHLRQKGPTEAFELSAFLVQNKTLVYLICDVKQIVRMTLTIDLTI